MLYFIYIEKIFTLTWGLHRVFTPMLDKQAIISEWDSHCVPHTSGLVLNKTNLVNEEHLMYWNGW